MQDGDKDQGAAVGRAREALGPYDRVLFESSSDAIMLLDASGFFDCNPATLELFRLRDVEQFRGMHPADLSPPEQPCGTSSYELARQRIEAAFSEGQQRFEWLHNRYQGDTFMAEVWLTAFELDGRQVLQATVRDITERQKDAEEIRRLQTELERQLAQERRRVEEATRDLKTDIRIRRKAERELQVQKAYFEKLFRANPEGIVILDNEDRIVDANPAWLRMFAYQLDHVRGRRINDLIVDEALEKEASDLTRQVLARRSVHGESIRRRSDGTPVPVSILGAPITLEDDSLGVFGIYRDISDRRRAEQALEQEKDLAQVTLHAIGDAVIRTDADSRVRYLNPVAERLTGWHLAEAVGRPLSDIYAVFDERDGRPGRNPVQDCMDEVRVVQLMNHTVLVARGGRKWAIEHTAAPIRNREGEVVGAVLVFRDVGERRRAAERMAHQARHDALTGLYNRRYFEAAVESLLADAASRERPNALLYLDLDQFKVVNDTCGHQAGDELLRRLTSLLAAEVRDSDVLARLGGDEFGLLLSDCPTERAMQIAQRLIETIRAFRFSWHDKTFSVGASVGLVEVGRTGDSLAGLLAAADSACYAAKEEGRNRVRLYTPDDEDLLRRHDEMNWVSRITRALEEERFVLHHQRIARRDGDAEGDYYEILVRMIDEDGELVPPGRFIIAAERYNLIPRLDRWVISEVCAGLARQALEGQATEMCAVNVSGTTLNDDGLSDFVEEKIEEHGVDPERLVFEITETAAVADLSRAKSFIQRMHDIGARIALDDFGAGISSFSYLKSLQVDLLKKIGRAHV